MGNSPNSPFKVLRLLPFLALPVGLVTVSCLRGEPNFTCRARSTNALVRCLRRSCSRLDLLAFCNRPAGYQLSLQVGIWVESFLLQKYTSSFLPNDHLHKIIHTPVTSSRKIQLYTGREMANQILYILLNPRRALLDKKKLPIWYDGRR